MLIEKSVSLKEHINCSVLIFANSLTSKHKVLMFSIELTIYNF